MKVNLSALYALYMTLFPQIPTPTINVTDSTPSKVSICSVPESIYDIQAVMLTPDPPIKGQNVTVSVSGHLKAAVEPQARIKASAKWGALPLPSIELDLCSSLSYGCPVRAGDNVLAEFTFYVPGYSPSGSYNVTTDMTQYDGSPIACLYGTVIL